MVPANRNGHLVIHYHGSGENQTAMRTDTAGKWPITQVLLDAGYMVASSAARLDNWGSPTAVTDYEALYAYVAGKWGVDKVLHLSQSMGGLTGLNVVGRSTVPADGWAGIFPVCSLFDMYGSGHAAPIKAAFGIAADGSDYGTKTSGYDPMLTTTSAFAGVPMRFYASPDDTVVPKSAHTDAFATKVASVTPEEDVVVCSGQHGDVSHFQPSDVLAFFARCIA